MIAGRGAAPESGLTLADRGATLRAMSACQCHQCGAAVEVDEPLARDAECPSCGRDLRCCLNCRHHDPNYHNQCRETEADQVEDRDRRNFCEFFSFTRAPFAPSAAGGTRESAARAKLDALFGGTPSASPSGTAREKLESLFKKPKPGSE